jgi:HlyD family secretion protein
VAAAAALAAYVALRPQPLLLETGPVVRGPAREYVTEEARTRLPQEYLIAMPDAGELRRITLEPGDVVTKDQVIAQLDDFDLQRELAGVDALIAQSAAHASGVDVQKPKPEDIETMGLRVKEAETALEIARKEHGLARVRLQQADREYQRVKSLLAQGVASAAEHDAAESAFRAAGQQEGAAAQAVQVRESEVSLARLAEARLSGSIDDNEYLRKAHEAEIARLQAQREILLNRIERTRIRAPISGVVIEKYEDSPRMLPAGSPLMKLGDPKHLEIECDILSDEIAAVREGNAVELFSPAIPAESARGTVRRIYPAAFTKRSSLGVEQQRVRVLIDFDNGALGLRPGVRLDVRIITAEKADALTVPDRAVFREGSGYYVFRVRQGRAERVQVRLGLRNDATAEILEGLAEGDTIVYEPVTTLAEGARVAAVR